MQQQKTELGEILLVGLTTRTNNRDEMDPKKSKIGPLAGLYWQNQTANAFKHREQPGVTFSVYTDYETDEHGEYTYFIGEQVSSLEEQDLSRFKSLTIPASTYAKFTTGAGKMPDIVISAWQQIWQMKAHDFGGVRRYLADFEIYDQRASDVNQAVIDLYIGVK